MAWAMSIVAFLFLCTFILTTQRGGTHTYPTRFEIDNHTFSITYIAANLTEQEAGLMNKTVGPNTTELFIFNRSADYPFWMLNTDYPLDMIWVLNGKIVYIQHDALPCLGVPSSDCAIYDPRQDADYVIEAAAGFANAHNISVGDSMNFS
jgi:uncharacterized membrane protein (UPF0127 family)